MFQADLLRVLSDFRVKSSKDFHTLPPGDKTYFIRRLYRAFIDNESSAFGDLTSAGGLKLHFATSGDLSLPKTNVPSTAFLKKLCFYSNRTLISFPFKELTRVEQSRAMKKTPTKAWRDSLKRQNRPILFGNIVSGRDGYGGWVGVSSSRSYTLDRAAFDDFLKLVSDVRPAVDAGLTYVLPTFPDKQSDYRRLSKRLVTANFKLEELNRQFMENELSESKGYCYDGKLLNLYLPYFTNVPIERVIEIRDQQKDMYEEFQRYLEDLFFGLSKQDTEIKFLGVLRDIDRGIRELEKQFRSLKSEYRRKDIIVGIGLVCTALAMYAGLEWGQEIGELVAAATGGATGMQFVSNIGERSNEKSRHMGSKFYLPWLIYNEAQQAL